MVTAQEVFEAMWRGPVAAQLHELGYEGSFRSFRLRSSEHTASITFQKSRYSTRESINYWVHLSIRSIQTKEPLWQEILGRVMPEWWNHLSSDIQADESPDVAGQKLAGDLREFGHRALLIGLEEPDLATDDADVLPHFRSRDGRPMQLELLLSGHLLDHGYDWDFESVEGLLALSTHVHPQVRNVVMSWLVRRFPDDDRVTPLLAALVQQDPHSVVRKMASSYLAFRDDHHDEVDAATRCAFEDSSFAVRWWGHYGSVLRRRRQNVS